MEYELNMDGGALSHLAFLCDSKYLTFRVRCRLPAKYSERARRITAEIRPVGLEIALQLLYKQRVLPCSQYPKAYIPETLR